MKKAILYVAAGISLVLMARKFGPSFVRELKQEFM